MLTLDALSGMAQRRPRTLVTAPTASPPPRPIARRRVVAAMISAAILGIALGLFA